MTFTVTEWAGDWISFERLIDSDDPYLERAWREADAAMRANRSAFSIMLPFFGFSIRRFWRWACRTRSRDNRVPIAGWHIEPLVFGDQDGFALSWLSTDTTVIATFAYHLDHMLAKGLEGKPCYVFRADAAPADSPFRVLVSMDPMPERAALADGGLASHLHFQYASSEDKLLKGTGEQAKLRNRMWYPTMCSAEGDLLAQCNIVRALHKLPAWPSLPDLAS